MLGSQLKPPAALSYCYSLVLRVRDVLRQFWRAYVLFAVGYYKGYVGLTVSLYLPMGAHAADDGHTGDEDADDHCEYPSSLHVGLQLVWRKESLRSEDLRG